MFFSQWAQNGFCELCNLEKKNQIAIAHSVLSYIINDIDSVELLKHRYNIN